MGCLIEGYVLCPYRSGARDRFRWAFGVLAPSGFATNDGSERSWMEVQFALRGWQPRLRARLRFLQPERHRVEVFDGERFQPTDRLVVDGEPLVPFEEGRLCEIDFDLPLGGGDLTLAVEGLCSDEVLRDRFGMIAGRVRRESRRLEMEVRVGFVAAPLRRRSKALGVMRLRVENVTFVDPDATTGDVLLASAVSAHVVVSVENGAFVPTEDPPAYAAPVVAACRSEGATPIVANDGGSELLVAVPSAVSDDFADAANDAIEDLEEIEEGELMALRTTRFPPPEPGAPAMAS